ncbi:hypothetical protein [Clostridium tagluense]|uniref:hypothetical protein n=1 Tax=Clostridium tagluense TaxID=360422 RepID=UPI001CF0E93F|nr:hypothetical protein [Clostridium tagluense]MCB2300647.1 hypothetical protein [Clostridium tagluense]
MEILNKIKNRVKAIYANLKMKIHDNNIKIKNFIKNNDVEILMFIGVSFISIATFSINIIAGLYIVGIAFILLSLFLLKHPLEVKK